MGIQPIRELYDYWQLYTPIAKCFSRNRFKQIWQAFTLWNPNLSLEQLRESQQFRVEPLATTICYTYQHYWAPGAHLAIDESMIPYFGHTRHIIKASHEPIKHGYKIWALGDLGYTYSWLWYSKTEGTEATKPIGSLAQI